MAQVLQKSAFGYTISDDHDEPPSPHCFPEFLDYIATAGCDVYHIIEGAECTYHSDEATRAIKEQKEKDRVDVMIKRFYTTSKNRIKKALVVDKQKLRNFLVLTLRAHHLDTIVGDDEDDPLVVWQLILRRFYREDLILLHYQTELFGLTLQKCSGDVITFLHECRLVYKNLAKYGAAQPEIAKRVHLCHNLDPVVDSWPYRVARIYRHLVTDHRASFDYTEVSLSLQGELMSIADHESDDAFYY